MLVAALLAAAATGGAPAPANLPRCSEHELGPGIEAPKLDARGDVRITVLLVDWGRACRVRVTYTFSIRWRDGTLFHRVRGNPVPVRYERQIAPKRRYEILLRWSNWCGPPVSVRYRLREGNGWMTSGMPLPGCHNPSAPSVIRVTGRRTLRGTG